MTVLPGADRKRSTTRRDRDRPMIVNGQLIPIVVAFTLM
jgi:hypothetical protein